MESVFEHATTALGDVAEKYIAERNRATGEDPEDIACDLGRAMLMSGCMWIGKSLGIGYDAASAPGKEALEKFDGMRSGPAAKGE